MVGGGTLLNSLWEVGGVMCVNVQIRGSRCIPLSLAAERRENRGRTPISIVTFGG